MDERITHSKVGAFALTVSALVTMHLHDEIKW